MGWLGVGNLAATAGYFFSRSHTDTDNKTPDSTSSPPDSRSEPPDPAPEEQKPKGHDAAFSTPPSLDDEEDGTQGTPKASASSAPLPVLAVPALNLNGDSSDNDNAPSVARGSSAQARVNGLGQERPLKTTNNAPSQTSMQPPSLAVTSSPQPPQPTPSLMPPPPIPLPRQTPQPKRAPPTLQPPRSSASSLRTPPSAAAGLRVPPSASTGLSNSTLAPTTVKKQASRKVVLEPGYSPLDWAARAANPNNQLRGAGLPPGLLRVTPSMLKMQNGRKGRDAWTSYQGKVYNISPYVPYHPGGKGELLRGAGKDSAQLFAEIHPWVNWDGILGECLVGILVSESDIQMENGLDAMD
ncbi:Cytochrome b5 reductase 4 [Penicillium rolfsii]|nr:Cytochrome b5 reductase 4 [Penicillium rolfsii]